MIVITALFLLASLTTVIGCSGDGEATSPEGSEIERFLKDEHVNAVLWEEWDIFDEFSFAFLQYGESLYFSGTQKYSNVVEPLVDRTAENYADLQSIDPPAYLSEFWSTLTQAMETFHEGLYGCYSQRQVSTHNLWLLQSGPTKNVAAWLELKRVCSQYSIPMEWPVPRSS